MKHKPNKWGVALEEAIEAGVVVGDEPEPRLKPEFFQAVRDLVERNEFNIREDQRLTKKLADAGIFERDLVESNTRLETDTTNDEE